VQAKIDATNYIIHNNAYSYEIYNISKFGSPDQSVVLWIKGNGTYEDVNLSTGCYIITIFSPDPSNRTIHVSENGTIRSLLFSVIWENDSYTAYGGNDGQTWLNGWMNFQCTDCAWRQVVCYDYNYNGTTIVSDECWATSYSALTACRGIDNDINSLCNRDSSKCHNTGIADVHNYPSTNLNTAHAEKFAGKTYDTCSAGNWTWDFATLFVIDHLNTSCIDNSNWCVQGAYYGSGNTQWTRLQDISCGTGTSCDSAIAGYVTFNKSYNYISSNNGSHYPCKIADGYACNVTADCLTGHSCISGTCGANGSTDLAIVNITPIQTVSNVKLVMGKSGFVVVEVKNNGPNNSTAEVGLTFDGSSLAITHKVIPATNQNSIWKNDSFVTITNRSTLAVNETKWFVFDFTPPYYCTNKTLNASVVIAS
jgi:hypothetical protein